MKLHETRHIDRPLHEVFALTADFSNAEKWDPGVASSKPMERGAPGVGSRYEVMVLFGSREIPMTYEITVLEQDSRVVLEGRGATITAVDDIRFEERDGGTLVDYTADLKFTNWMRFITPLLASTLTRVGEKALDGLVETLER